MKKSKNTGNCYGSYDGGSNRPALASQPFQSAMPTYVGGYSRTLKQNLIHDSHGAAPSFVNTPSFYYSCYNSEEPRHMRRVCPRPCMSYSVQQQTRLVVQEGIGGKGRERQQCG